MTTITFACPVCDSGAGTLNGTEETLSFTCGACGTVSRLVGLSRWNPTSPVNEVPRLEPDAPTPVFHGLGSLPSPTIIRGAVRFARETWRRDGAEGETVHLLADVAEMWLETKEGT